MHTTLFFLINAPVAIIFIAFAIGGGVLLPLWEYLDSRDPGTNPRDERPAERVTA